MDYRLMTAPCGLDCFNCPAYFAVDNGETREMISKMFEIPIEKASCRGCRIEGGTCLQPFGAAPSCRVYTCVGTKGVDFCSECEDFPCDFLHPYADKASIAPHNTKVFNLCLIKKMGLEKWAREKARHVRGTYFQGAFKL